MSGTLRQDDVAMQSSVKTVLAVDVGGSSVKILATGQSERRSFSSGPTLTPRRMVSEVKKLAGDWMRDVAVDRLSRPCSPRPADCGAI